MPPPPSIRAYIKEITSTHSGGNATEHSFRADLQKLMQELLPAVHTTNEPRRIECGAPDYVLTHNDIPLGYIEAKDLDKSLDDKAHHAQLKRYVESLDNLIFTNYLEFRFYRDGEMKPAAAVAIAELRGAKIKPLPENFARFTDLIKTFGAYEGQTITAANDLARRMAHKARMLAATVNEALAQDDDAQIYGDKSNEMENVLQGQLSAFREHLIHDLDGPGFADIYAQTVAYGMFAARLHDPTPATFTRREAADLIPSTNPFLRKFFQHIAGYDLDPRIRWIVDDLADVFRAADVGELMKGYGKATQQNDPFIHFYETFLGEYDPKLRKSRGVYYTPEPVVNFIVRAVDEILRTEFNLKDGLADTSKTVIEIEGQPSTDKRKKGKAQTYNKEVHRVQILDPAVGTGTFLAAIVQEIYSKQFAAQKGIWPDYVKQDLIPRLNGFEVLLASYAMAHTKLEMVLREKGCDLDGNRLRIYLTNSLEEHHPDTGTLFAQWLSAEANEANFIKRDTPVMVVIGNPPYSVESANKGEWIADLLQDYKQEPGGGKLQEKNSKSLNDDYVKFIRYGQHYIDRTGEGVLAYVNNHGFLDNPTFRGMRWSLLQSFDAIYLIDLHGNSKKKETAPDGSADKNVFDIQQGVSINLFVKTGKKKNGELARVFHHDLYGERQSKYKFLWGRDFKQIDFSELKPQAPQYFFVPMDYELQSEYEGGFSIKDLFLQNGSGVGPKRDSLAIHFSKEKALEAARDILDMEKEDFYRKYNLPPDVRDWRYEWAKTDIEQFGVNDKLIQPIQYRPFDTRSIVYTGKTRGFIGWPVLKIMRHFIEGENVGLITIRNSRSNHIWREIFVTNTIATSATSITTLDKNFVCPLYVYPEEKQQSPDEQQSLDEQQNPDNQQSLGEQQNPEKQLTLDKQQSPDEQQSLDKKQNSEKQLTLDEQQNSEKQQTREPNLNPDIIKTIAEKLSLNFTPEKIDDNNSFAPIDLLDYIYATLHNPAYRQKYREFLKTDFPRVPYPTDQKQFRALAQLGTELRSLHLMESPTLDTLITTYPETGDNTVTKPHFEITDPTKRLGKVHINPSQHFTDVPEVAWNFHIGGYQPAQKWLKDRKGRTLDHQDIIHYQKIIVALTETAAIMETISGL